MIQQILLIAYYMPGSSQNRCTTVINLRQKSLPCAPSILGKELNDAQMSETGDMLNSDNKEI